MKKLFALLSIFVTVLSCTNNNTRDTMQIVDNRIPLRTDTTNFVTLSDTLIIFESTCRGCAYEGSTNFGISDSMHLIKLLDVITTDNSSAEMAGGSISKDLILVPQKTGTTMIKVYKFWTQEKTAADSARFTAYQIEVKQ